MTDPHAKPVIRKWSKDEEADLLKHGTVANRSEGACAIRRKVIAARRVGEGKDADVVAKDCGVSVDEINDQIKIESAKKRKTANIKEGATKTVSSTAGKDIDAIISSLKELKKRVDLSC